MVQSDIPPSEEEQPLSSLRSQLGRARESATTVARDVASRSAESARKAQDTARERLDAGVAAVTMEDWRSEVESALSDITAVLLAMDARLSALEQRDD